jgi:hypothetical protein
VSQVCDATLEASTIRVLFLPRVRRAGSRQNHEDLGLGQALRWSVFPLHHIGSYVEVTMAVDASGLPPLRRTGERLRDQCSCWSWLLLSARVLNRRAARAFLELDG